MLINIHFLVFESFHTKLVQNSSVVSEKIMFEFLYVHDLGQGQKMTLTFNTHKPSYSHLVVCICQLSGHRLQ